jgi:hypothetical protein
MMAEWTSYVFATALIALYIASAAFFVVMFGRFAILRLAEILGLRRVDPPPPPLTLDQKRMLYIESGRPYREADGRIVGRVGEVSGPGIGADGDGA